MNNYRPISLLCVMSKILEKHVYNNVISYFNRNKLLVDNQSGSRSNHSCQTGLTKLVNSWYNSMNAGEVIGCVTIDMRKAFDLVNIDILLKKLKVYGFSDGSILWFKSYLKGRFQQVVVNDVVSESCPIEYGIPQGSILGILLFLIHINDFPLHVDNSSVDLYVDDTTLYCSKVTVNDVTSSINKDLEDVSTWCDMNRLIVNEKKSKTSLICSSQKRTRLDIDSYNIVFNNDIIEYNQTQKILGVHIDDNLSWKNHVDYTCTKISRLIGLLNRLKYYVSKKVLVMFYNVHVIPIIDFCLNVWGHAADSHMHRLQVLQNRAGRIILGVDFDTSIRLIHSDLCWLTIRQRLFYQTCTLMYKVFNGGAPSYLNTFEYTDSTYSLRSISTENLLVPRPKMESFRNSFSYSGAYAWNQLPSNIKNAPNVFVFKKMLKQHILLIDN